LRFRSLKAIDIGTLLAEAHSRFPAISVIRLVLRVSRKRTFCNSGLQTYRPPRYLQDVDRSVLFASKKKEPPAKYLAAISIPCEVLAVNDQPALDRLALCLYSALTLGLLICVTAEASALLTQVCQTVLRLSSRLSMGEQT